MQTRATDRGRVEETGGRTGKPVHVTIKNSEELKKNNVKTMRQTGSLHVGRTRRISRDSIFLLSPGVCVFLPSRRLHWLHVFKDGKETETVSKNKNAPEGGGCPPDSRRVSESRGTKLLKVES